MDAFNRYDLFNDVIDSYGDEFEHDTGEMDQETDEGEYDEY